jgi:hypothetical protein
MNFLIKLCNNVSKFLIKRLSQKIAFIIEEKIFLANLEYGTYLEVKYQWNDENAISFDIIMDNRLSYDDDLTVCKIIQEVEEKYSAIEIQFLLWTKEEYKQNYGDEK